MLNLPRHAYHACRYADWTDAAFCRLPRAAQASPLPAAERYVATIAAALDVTSLPRRFTVVDTHNDAVYATPATPRVAPLTDWQAEVLVAIRHLRRWRLYSDSPE